MLRHLSLLVTGMALLLCAAPASAVMANASVSSHKVIIPCPPPPQIAFDKQPEATSDNNRYHQLQEEFNRYLALASSGGWPTIRAGQTLESGKVHPANVTLRLRLALTNDYRGPLVISDLFDEELEQAVRRFQHRHGLAVDGKVGAETRAALNVPARVRAAQIQANLRRLQESPAPAAERYLLINMAAFQLEAIEEGESVLTMRVIIGRPLNSTPTFSEKLDYLVINPYWNIPTKLAVRDFLPTLRRDPGRLERIGIRVYAGWNDHAERLDPTTIDWQAVSPASFHYKLRQDPGPHNALGRVKFVFPNRYAIYLHDTPNRRLFNKDIRTFSSGCIRVEEPVELATYLLSGQGGWTRDALEKQIASGRQQVVRLEDKRPVHLVYWTAWIDREGTLHFRDDIYERDGKTLQIIAQQSPATLLSSNRQVTGKTTP